MAVRVGHLAPAQGEERAPGYGSLQELTEPLPQAETKHPTEQTCIASMGAAAWTAAFGNY